METKSLSEIMTNPDVIKNQMKVMEAYKSGESLFESLANLNRSLNEAMMPELRIERQKKEN